MTILIVEDHPGSVHKAGGALCPKGLCRGHCRKGDAALAYLRQKVYDLVILDLGLPDMDGLELLARRCSGMARCLILTARDGLEDRVRGLDLGADDYVLKPFALEELDARIRAVLRRPAGTAPEMLTCGSLRFDTHARQAAVAGKALPLSRREGMLLEEAASPVSSRGHQGTA